MKYTITALALGLAMTFTSCALLEGLGESPEAIPAAVAGVVATVDTVATTGDATGLLTGLAGFGVPAWLVGLLGLGFAVPRTRSKLLTMVQAATAVVGLSHSSPESKAAAEDV